MPRPSRWDRFAVDQLCARRDFVVRSAELDRLGVPRSTVSRRCGPDGPWQRLHPGVLLLRSGHPTERQRLTAALLYARGGAIFTGATALRLYGVKAAPGPQVHVLVPHRRRRASRPDLVVERTSRLPEHRNVGGMPCAPVARAAIDATRRLTRLDDVRAVLAEVVQRRLTTVAALAEELRAAPTHGSALPRRVLREVSGGVRSVAEAKGRQLLEEAGITGAVWNQPVLTRDGRFLGTPDAVWVDLGVALEIDSLEFHLAPREYRETLARRARFAAAGVIVVAVVPSQLSDDPAAVVAAVRGALQQAADRPSLGLRLAPWAA